MVAYADRVKETTTTTGTGSISMGGAVSGFRAFSSAFATGTVVHYTIDDGAGNWEVGLGTLTTGTPWTMSRDTVYASSNSGALVNFGAGSKAVFATLAADGVIRSQLGTAASPSYSNSGGTGDRRSTITASASGGLLGGGTAPNLLDSDTSSNNYTNSVSFNAVSVSSSYYLRFDFGAGAQKVITEVKWYQTNTASHGTWKWQGSNDASSWADVGASFTLGGVATQTQTSLASNTTGYRYYQLIGVSGTANAGPYIYEVQFKIGSTVLDGVGAIPSSGSTNALLTKASGTTYDVQWTAASDYVASAEAARRLPSCVASYWPCDEGRGTQLRDIVGTQTFDWTTTGYGGTVGWSTDGRLQTQAGYFKTPSQTTQTLILVFKVAEGITSNYFCNTPDLNGYLSDQALPTTANATLRMMDGWGIRDIPRRTAGTCATDWFAGGWCMVSVSQTAATTGTCGIGGYNYNTSNCVSLMQVEGIVVCSTAPNDSELRQILNFVREHKRRRGVYLTPWDCPRAAHLVRVVGESTAAGTALLSGLSDRSSNNENVLIQARNSSSATTTGLKTQKLVYTASYANANAPSDASTKFGLERGLMLARIERYNDGRPLHIAKLGNGSTYLVPAATYSPNAAGGSTTVAGSQCRYPTPLEPLVATGLFFTLEWRNSQKIERQARDQGIGYTSVTDIWCEGLNDAYIGTAAVPDAATYQGYLQEYRDKTKTYLGISNLKQILLKPHNPSGGLGGGDPDYPNTATGTDRLTALGYIRTACDNFQTANSADVTVLDGDTYGVNSPSDYTHPSGTQYETMGRAMEALLSYATQVTPAA